MGKWRTIATVIFAGALLAVAPSGSAQRAPDAPTAAAANNELEAARAPLRAALRAAQRANGRDHADTIAARDALITHLMDEAEPPPETHSLIRDAIASATRANDSAALAVHTSQLARVLEGEGRFDAAVEAWQAHVAATRANSAAEYLDVSFALRDLAAAQSSAGRREDSVRTYQQAIAVVETAPEAGPNHPDTADAVSALALEYVGRGEPQDLAQAETLFTRAIAIVRAAPNVRPRTRAYIFEQYAELLSGQYRYAEAAPFWMSVVQDLITANAPASQLHRPVREFATAVEAQGLYVEAAGLYEQALDLVRNSSRPSSTSERILHRAAARTLAIVGRNDEATVHLERALALAPNTDVSQRASLRALARHHERAERWEEAASVHERLLARASAGATQSSPNETRMLLQLRDLARVRLAQGRPADAEANVRRSIAIVSRRPNGNLAPLNNDLAVTLLAQGRADAQTLALLDEAFQTTARTNTSRPIIAENRLWAALAGNAPADALALRVGDIRARNRSEEPFVLAATRNGDALETAALVVRAIVRLDALAPAGAADRRALAFAGLQSAYYSATSRAVAEAAAERAAEGAQAALVTQWRAANGEADTLRIELDDLESIGDPSPAITRIERALADAQARRTAAENELSNVFPRFFDLISPEPVPLPAAQALLGEDEVLIVLYPGDMALPAGHRTGAVFAATRERTALAELPLDPTQLTDTITALQRSLRTSSAPRAPGGATPMGARAYDRAAAHTLYRALFGAPDIAALAEDKQRWTIVPLGALLNTPFAALVTAPPTGNGLEAEALRNTSWLGTTRWLTIAPSVSVLRTQRADQPTQQSRDVTFFGLGDPSFEGAPAARGTGSRIAVIPDTGNIDLDAIRQLPRLPGTRIEIEGLANTFRASRSDYVLGDAANEEELTARNADLRLQRADVIAFATHGLVAGRLGGVLIEPSLALTPPQAVTHGNDGLLSASEAARLQLRARWVILSACDTAAGGTPDAAGLTGLARAFFYAGARALLVSQWPVDDTAAQKLTTAAVRFQQEAAVAGRTMSAAEAMQRSMRALLDNDTRDGADSFAHPRMWAPFLLVTGDR